MKELDVESIYKDTVAVALDGRTIKLYKRDNSTELIKCKNDRFLLNNYKKINRILKGENI